MQVKGRIGWTRDVTSEGHRTYKVQWLCVGTSLLDGPGTAAGAAGLPVIGTAWAYGSDSDPWALRTPEESVRPVIVNEPGRWWVVEQTFSTRPRTRCQDDSIENPLMEPPKIKGGFVKYSREATRDRTGKAIKSSSHEMFRGAAVEFDDNRPTVSISMNLASLPIVTFSGMVDTVNGSSLWGLSKRHVKLSGVSWERLLYGTCNYYYTVNYEFDIQNGELGFDRKIIDEGTKVLGEGGNPTLLGDFVTYKDINGENGRVLLNGLGSPLASGASPHEILVEYYPESNFLTLGIPTSF